jgi:hypothetical protein
LHRQLLTGRLPFFKINPVSRTINKRVGVWACGRVGVWACGRVGVWACGRVGV